MSPKWTHAQGIANPAKCHPSQKRNGQCFCFGQAQPAPIGFKHGALGQHLGAADGENLYRIETPKDIADHLGKIAGMHWIDLLRAPPTNGITRGNAAKARPSGVPP